MGGAGRGWEERREGKAWLECKIKEKNVNRIKFNFKKRKGQASYEYQPATAYQVAVRLATPSPSPLLGVPQEEESAQLCHMCRGLSGSKTST